MSSDLSFYSEAFLAAIWLSQYDVSCLNFIEPSLSSKGKIPSRNVREKNLLISLINKGNVARNDAAENTALQ
ncbi:MAG: hypothetical protein AMK71_08235 [Nitrospira bacterium SG8_35_4]|nr:MAG: hypothetical protein AMK71_08235 [Nitrospira bacterium SG8_35_4]